MFLKNEKKNNKKFLEYFQGNHCFLLAKSPSSAGIPHGLIKMNKPQNLPSFQLSIFNSTKKYSKSILQKNTKWQ